MTNGHEVVTTDDRGCFWHGAEPIPPNVFRVCYECGHAYPTREDVAAEHRHAYAGAFPGYPPPTDDEIARAVDTFCPLCVHDW